LTSGESRPPNRDLEQMIADGLFWRDLYYRLNVFHAGAGLAATVPRDIPALVHHFSRPSLRACWTSPASRVFRPRRMEALRRRAMARNIRELENVVERAVISLGGAGSANVPAGRPPADPFPAQC